MVNKTFEACINLKFKRNGALASREACLKELNAAFTRMNKLPNKEFMHNSNKLDDLEDVINRNIIDISRDQNHFKLSKAERRYDRNKLVKSLHEKYPKAMTYYDADGQLEDWARE